MKGATRWQIIERHDPDFLAPTIISRIEELERRVHEGEHGGLRARWECGHYLLSLQDPGKKQLDKGLLEAAAKRVVVSYKEMSRRVTLARRYPTEEELGHAVSKFPTWHEMVRDGLRRDSKPRPPRNEDLAAVHAAVNTIVRRWLLLQSTDLTEEERAVLEQDLARLEEVLRA